MSAGKLQREQRVAFALRKDARAVERWIDEANEFFGLFGAERTEFYLREPLLAGQ